MLTTSFGPIYVHAGRTAETDALFTLLILLTVVTLWSEQSRPWHGVWLGLLAAAAFLLRGMAVLMPLSIVLAVKVGRRGLQRNQWMPTGAAMLLFVAPVTAWIVARWRVDEWRFLERLLNYDFLARSFTVIEGHPGTPFYYLNILQGLHYDWLVAGAVAWILFPIPWSRVRNLLGFWRTNDRLSQLVGSWAAITLLIPTLMRTKLPWYLNPFYPVFALGTGWILVHAFSQVRNSPPARWRTVMLGFVAVIALGVAEGRLISYSFRYRDVGNSAQGLLLAEKDRLAGRRVFRDHWDRADIFVLGGVVGADRGLADYPEHFLRDSRPGDYLLSSQDADRPDLVLVRSDGRLSLYRRRQ